MHIKTIDTHMSGSPTRIITDGLPEIKGASMTEKMHYFSTHHDDLRKLLILEPRGHKHMWGVVLTEPSNAEADIGAFFVNSEGSFPICIHSTISLVKVLIEYGLIDPPADGEAVKLDLPVGVTRAYPRIVDGKVTTVSVECTDAFVHTPSIKLLLETGNFITASIVYSGVYFLLIDVNQVGFYDQRAALLESSEGIQKLVTCAMNALNQVNKKYTLSDPVETDHTTKVAMAMFYDEINAEQANDLVVRPTGAVDRSPCGSAIGAKLALLHSQGRIGQSQPYELFSPIHTQLTGEILSASVSQGHDCILPKVTGNAYVTGEHKFILDPDDPITSGFVL